MKIFSLSRFKRVSITLLACITIASAAVGIIGMQPAEKVFKIAFASELDAENVDGMSFTAEPLYVVNKNLEALPQTFEAEVFLPKTSSGRAGSILGNWGLGAS